MGAVWAEVTTLPRSSRDCEIICAGIGNNISFLYLVTKDHTGKPVSSRLVGMCKGGEEWVVAVIAGTRKAKPNEIEFATVPSLQPLAPAVVEEIRKTGKVPRGTTVFNQNTLSRELSREAARRGFSKRQ